MEVWMYGAGSDLPASVRRMREMGVTTVVGGASLAEHARAAGMNAWLCSGAYGYTGAFVREEYLSRDIYGKPRLWFGSCCPCKADVREKNLQDIREMTRTPGITGVIIDGARFASPASSGEFDAFFTCFCPDCVHKAQQYGYDTDRMLTAAQALHRRLTQGEGDVLTHAVGLSEWFDFRRRATTEHLRNFAAAVKQQNPALLCGIYIFTPSLSYLVGQCYEDLRDVIDVFCPMIYRAYRDSEGPACLNHELAAVFTALCNAVGEERAGALISGLTGAGRKSCVSAEQLLGGLPPEIVRTETRKAAARLSGKGRLVPILQFDDRSLDETMTLTMEGGADAVSLFAYRDEYEKEYGALLQRAAQKP